VLDKSIWEDMKKGILDLFLNESVERESCLGVSIFAYIV
jgi:hypothetical protein